MSSPASASAQVIPTIAKLASADTTLMAEAISCRFGDFFAVREASLSLQKGTITALLGSSGSGKSTFLRLLAGLEPVHSGRIRLGETVFSAPGFTLAPQKRNLGLVFQDYALFPHLSALDNVAFGLEAPQSREARRVALDWLDQMGLAHRAQAFPHELSGGEQQRVALARALAPAPAALLLDEPFSGLAPSFRAELRERTAKLIRRSGITALLVTHDADEAQLMADHLAIMHEGKIVQVGDCDEIYWRPRNRLVAAALGPINHCAGRVRDQGLDTPWGRFDLSVDPSASDAPNTGLAELHQAGELCFRAEGVAFFSEPRADRVAVELVSLHKQGAFMAVTIRLKPTSCDMPASHDTRPDKSGPTYSTNPEIGGTLQNAASDPIFHALIARQTELDWDAPLYARLDPRFCFAFASSL